MEKETFFKRSLQQLSPGGNEAVGRGCRDPPSALSQMLEREPGPYGGAARTRTGVPDGMPVLQVAVSAASPQCRSKEKLETS